jgi:hypothetical protein
MFLVCVVSMGGKMKWDGNEEEGRGSREVKKEFGGA